MNVKGSSDGLDGLVVDFCYRMLICRTNETQLEYKDTPSASQRDIVKLACLRSIHTHIIIYNDMYPFTVVYTYMYMYDNGLILHTIKLLLFFLSYQRRVTCPTTWHYVGIVP